jgi:hypothetical protein
VDKVAEGDRELAAGDSLKAEKAYEEAICTDRANQAAVAGVRQAQQYQPDNPLVSWQKAADDVVGDYLKPLGQLILLLLGVVVLGYVVALLARLAARWPAREVRSPFWRRVLGWSSALIMVIALATAALAVATPVLRRETERWPALLLVAVGVLVIGCLLRAIYLRSRRNIELDVVDAAGTRDIEAGQQLVACLVALGKQGPEGVRLQRSTDVTGLPEPVLAAVPGGKVLGAMITFLRAAAPFTPWRGSVVLAEGSNRMTVTIERNGRFAAHETADFSRLIYPGTDVETPTAVDPAERITLAAAVILSTLADQHPELGRGLNGATRWESIAGQVLATEPPMDAHPKRRKALLQYAANIDPDNLAARVALLVVNGPEGTDQVEAWRKVAAKFDTVYEELSDKAKGSDAEGREALRWRVGYNRVVAWYNAYLSANRRTVNDWCEAVERLRALMHDLAWHHPFDSTLKTFLDEMRPAAGTLWQGMDATKPTDEQMPDECTLGQHADRWAAQWQQAGPPLHYNRACLAAEQASTKTGDARQKCLKEALSCLEIAVVQPDLKRYARRDPSLTALRTHRAREFSDLVRDPQLASFTALASAPPRSCST